MDKFTCEHCQKLFSSPQALKIHLKTAKKCLLSRKTHPILECDYCLKEFPGEESLQRHETTCKFKERFCGLLEENKKLKQELFLVRKELKAFQAKKRKEQTTKKNSLQDTENFEEEFLEILKNVSEEDVAKGVKRVVGTIKELSVKEEKHLWVSNKRKKTVTFMNDGAAITETFESNEIMASVMQKFFPVCEEKVYAVITKSASDANTYSIDKMWALLKVKESYSSENKNREKEFWKCIV
uniref:Zinc finger protein n=1 Tax=Marseillevirus sp. TaxID=2809551 RepID=A0AA96EKI4_9VIRU|nr:zinc finger protein [Marseillevirus sp.]